MKFLCNLIVFFLISTVSCSSANEFNDSAWVNMTLNDLSDIHKQLKNNTVGAIDRDNPTFATWLEEGYLASQEKAKQVRTFGGYLAALRYYAAGFRDEHINLWFQVNPDGWRWPGFTLTYSNGDFIVSYVAKGRDFPKVGDKAIAFDNVPTKEMILTRVFPYFEKVPSLEADIYRATPRLLFDHQNQF